MGDSKFQIEELWSDVVKNAYVMPDRGHSLRFTGCISETAGHGLTIALDERWDVFLGSEGVGPLRTLAELLPTAALSGRIAAWDLELELLREVGRVLLPGSDLSRAGSALLRRLSSSTAGAIVVVPLGGLYSSAEGPMPIGDSAVVGHVSRETEGAIAELARRTSAELDGFRFTSEAWWTEEFLAAEEDAYIAAELAEVEAEQGLWQPLTLALATDYVGVAAAHACLQATEAILGAIVLLEADKDSFYEPHPWILGTPTIAATSRSPVIGSDGVLPTQPLQVDSRPGRNRRAVCELPDEVPTADLDIAPILASENSLGVVRELTMSAWSTVNEGRQTMSLACALGLQAYRCRGDASVFLLQTALDLLNGCDVVDAPAEATGGHRHPSMRRELSPLDLRRSLTSRLLEMALRG